MCKKALKNIHFKTDKVINLALLKKRKNLVTKSFSSSSTIIPPSSSSSVRFRPNSLFLHTPHFFSPLDNYLINTGSTTPILFFINNQNSLSSLLSIYHTTRVFAKSTK